MTTVPRTRKARNGDTARFGPLLRAKRKEAGYTIGGLAGLLGLKPAQLSAIERGIDAPLDEAQIRRAARVLETPAKPLADAAERDLEAAFQRQWPMPASR